MKSTPTSSLLPTDGDASVIFDLSAVLAQRTVPGSQEREKSFGQLGSGRLLLWGRIALLGWRGLQDARLPAFDPESAYEAAGARQDQRRRGNYLTAETDQRFNTGKGIRFQLGAYSHWQVRSWFSFLNCDSWLYRPAWQALGRGVKIASNIHKVRHKILFKIIHNGEENKNGTENVTD